MILIERQNCSRNCMGCSASSLAKRFYCEKNLRNLRPIFLLIIYDYSCLSLIVAFERSVSLT